MIRNALIPVCAIIVVLVVSCSGSPVEPTESGIPMLTGAGIVDQAGTGRYLWGYWDCAYDAGASEFTAVPNRGIQFHMNVVKPLEDNPDLCTDCIMFGENQINGDGDLEVNIFIKHPIDEDTNYKKEVFTGFDVRGICIFHGTEVFDEMGVVTCSEANNEFILVDPSGYTYLWSPTNFAPDSLGREIFEYYPGKYEVNGIDMPTTLNPFMEFHTLNERRTFEAGETSGQVYTIRFPDGPADLEFGYAVDASWFKPSNMDAPNVPDDFPIAKANCMEAYRITANMDSNLTPIGGTADLYIKVYDWQGPSTITEVAIEAPDIFNGIIIATKDEEKPLYTQYIASFENELKAQVGTYPVLVRVGDTTPSVFIGSVDAYQMFEVEIVPPLTLEDTVIMDNFPIEGNFDAVTQTCYFTPVPGVATYPIIGIDDLFNTVEGFDTIFPTGGMGLCMGTQEIFVATDTHTEDWTQDVTVFDISTKSIDYFIDIPSSVPGNAASRPVDFVVFELSAETWVSLFADDQVGVFFTGSPDPPITRVDVGEGPTVLSTDEANYRIFVACDGNDTITVIDGFTHDIDGSINLHTPLESPDPGLPATVGMAYVPWADKLYVATLLYGRIDIYDMETYEYEESIQLVDEGTEVVVGAIYDPVTGLIIATGGHVVPGQGYVWLIDPETNLVLDEAATTDKNPSFPGLDSTNHLVFVPDPAGHVDIFRIIV